MNKHIKNILIILLLVVILSGAFALYNRFSSEYTPSVSPSADEETGATIPNFSVLDENGNTVSLSDYYGKPIVLNIWATWCVYCKQEMPDFNDAYLNHPDVQFLMVNATDGVRETMELAESYVSDNGFAFPVVYDTNSEVVSSLFVRSFPSTYFIDSQGRLVSYQSGKMSRDVLEQHIQTLLSKNNS